jgi:hypothetical protein
MRRLAAFFAVSASCRFVDAARSRAGKGAESASFGLVALALFGASFAPRGAIMNRGEASDADRVFR